VGAQSTGTTTLLTLWPTRRLGRILEAESDRGAAAYGRCV
jgi:hypothetical protein